MEVVANSTCINIFLNDSSEERGEAFTALWTKVINQNEETESYINLLHNKKIDL